jgi:F-type H+-transporting ATPase subunit delta
LATRYATALFELARDANRLEEVERDLGSLASALSESPELRRLVASPMLSRDDQKRAITGLAERIGLGNLVHNFLGVLASNRRLFAISEITEKFRAMVATARGEVLAEVVSARELTGEQLSALEEGVGRFTGRKVSVTRSVDPSLLGGLLVRVGSRMIDASLKSKLQQLELSMRGLA